MISMLTGTTAADFVGLGLIKVGTGNFLVTSAAWNNGSTGATRAGAVTFGHGSTGFIGGGGPITPVNSLIGSSTNDTIGWPNSGSTITVLPNGNYLVLSPQWTNPANGAAYAGAVTFGSGATGATGTVSPANSRVGSSAGDQVGGAISGINNITILTNGNYVVTSPYWDNTANNAADAGAVFFGLATAPITGTVAAANSLVGRRDNDSVGNLSVTSLPNGNYLVRSSLWDRPGATDAGAVTFASGITGIKGA